MVTDESGTRPPRPRGSNPTPVSAASVAAAKELICRQPALRSRLSAHLSSLPRTGLYADEGSPSGGVVGRRESDFASFVARVRSSLALSPKTVMLRAVDDSLSEIRRRMPDEMAELSELAGVPADAPMRALSAAVERMPRGRLHDRWRSATETSRGGGGGCGGARTEDPANLRRRVAWDMRLRNEGRGPTDAEVESVIRRAEEGRERRRAAAAARAAALGAELGSDPDHRRWRRARELWESTGAERLWEGFREAAAEEGRERRRRGGGFEDGAAAVCSAAIALGLSRSAGTAASSYSYVRGARWLTAAGRLAGEVDLVVLGGAGEVAALCEMKRDSVEVGNALQQHESKLRAALDDPPTMYLTAEDGETRLCLPRHEPCGRARDELVEIFVATRLPTGPTLGVEPALSHAICQGIRAQGLQVRNENTEAAAAVAGSTTNLPDLLASGFPACAPEAAINREGLAGGEGFLSANSSGDVDIAELERFVRRLLGSERLMESPAASFRRLRHRVLVMMDEDIRSRAGAREASP